MKRTVKVKWGEIRVGLLLVFAVTAVLWATFSGGGTSVLESKVKYMAYFTNVQGLVTGSPVWIAGVEVGNVYSIEFVNYDSTDQIQVKFRILKSVQNMITSDALAQIGTIGLIGDKYVEIIPGSLDKPVLAEGSAIQSTRPADITQAFASGQEAMESTRQLADNLNDITRRIRRGEGSLGKAFVYDTLYNEVTKLVAALTILVKDMQSTQGKVVASIDNIAANLDGIVDKVNSNQGTLGKIISDPSVFNNLHSSTGRIDSILARLSQGDGTAGAILTDDDLYVQTKNLIVRIENLVADIEKNPRKYFKFSVF
jgi:phospholipid/cholesterol/gamma-HCH transport system substrate-binding protein